MKGRMCTNLEGVCATLGYMPTLPRFNGDHMYDVIFERYWLLDGTDCLNGKNMPSKTWEGNEKNKDEEDVNKKKKMITKMDI